MRKIVECVPNFSEGRDRATIDAIAEAIGNTSGCAVLDVDPGESTNRTVYTFVGAPDAVVEGALAAARVAKSRIDMREHTGTHPRMGALDVCPFVPVANVTMDECVACAKEFGRRAAEELGVPIYLYEAAATQTHRRSLKDIRAGEYEGLSDKLADPKWRPDYGPANLVPTWGATAAGARFFLIAYNVNILGTKEQAHRIALDVREQGRGPEAPGLLKAVKGIGWYVEEYGLAQVSMNLEDYRVTPMHVAFEACVERAKGLNVAVAGSELVGLIPKEAMLLAADHYIDREQLLVLDERQKMRLVIERLGLSSVTPFDPDERVIDYMIDDETTEPLASASVREFVEQLGARTSAPGGGSAAALMAAMGAALGTMVGQLTFGRRKFEAVDGHMRSALPHVYQAMKALLPMIDADTEAFQHYVTATAMPQGTEGERQRRHAAMQAGLKQAVEVPLATMRTADRAWDAMIELARHANIAMRSDLEVGAKALESGVWGCHRNVLINLTEIEDKEYTTRVREESQALAARARDKLEEVVRILAGR